MQYLNTAGNATYTITGIVTASYRVGSSYERHLLCRLYISFIIRDDSNGALRNYVYECFALISNLAPGQRE